MTGRWVPIKELTSTRYGPDHPGAVEYEKGWRVRVYIDTYIKGPPGLPIVQSRKVYDLRR